MPTVLLTGGAGYIGSHTCVEVMAAGWRAVILDNLCNSSREVIGRLEKITGQRPAFVEGDVTDAGVVDALFETHGIEAVIHFAGLKAVGESVARPLAYYRNNVAGSITLLEAMQRRGVKRIVFSSSATVYGAAEGMPLEEGAPLGPTNPYGRTKLMVEEIIRDTVASDADWRAVLLRYFNPVGAHASALIGEDPADVPNNLMPFVSQVAVGRREELQVFGNDYPTPDGTGVRDYIHVVDLARGHVAALRYMLERPAERVATINLGTGRGHTVLEVVRAFEQASGRRIPYRFAPRRSGDVATCYADVKRARAILGWEAERGLTDMCTDAWRWQSRNPQGYRDAS